MEQAALTFSPAEVAGLAHHYEALAARMPLAPIATAEGYDRAVTVLNALMDAGAGDEAHPLAGLLALIGERVAAYDDAHRPIPDASPASVLAYFMVAHELRQSDLAEEIGSQGVVSEILSGKRSLTVSQIQRLARRFGVAPGTFLAS